MYLFESPKVPVFSIYFDELFRKKTDISIRMSKEKEMRSKLANNQVFMPVACRKSPKSYDCRNVYAIGKIDYYLLNKNETLIECLWTCSCSSNRRFLVFICKIWDALYILQGSKQAINMAALMFTFYIANKLSSWKLKQKCKTKIIKYYLQTQDSYIKICWCKMLQFAKWI